MTHNISTIDYSRKWWVMAVLGMGIFLATIDGSIVNIALPTLVKQFDARFETVQWVALSYMLTLATLMLSIGRLADMVGKKPIYFIGMILFTLGSLMCGLSQTIYQLIAFRIFQAIGASMMLALGIGILTESFPPQERGKALGISGAIVSIGIILGPTLGGMLIDLISWHWIFFVNLPIGIVGSFMVIRILPNTKGAAGQKFDFPGAVALFVSLLAFLLALTVGQKIGFTHPIILSLLGTWFIFFIIFLVAEIKTNHPMVDLRLFRNQLFSLSLFTGFITFVCTGGIVLLMPFYLENVLHYDPHQAGLLMAIVPVSAGIISPLSGSLSDRFGTRPVAIVGLIFMLIGYSSLLSLSATTTTIGYLIRFFPVGLGIGVFQSPNNSAIMGTASKEKLGVVSSLLSLTRTLGQTSGIAALGAFWAFRVAAHSHQAFDFSAANTDPIAQVSGLFDTFIIAVGFTAIALALSVISCVREKACVIGKSMIVDGAVS
ncbi:DHA2 family efflux MFS transporter permease subunit [candidate division KSB1 bacterium]|nr:DHA2 family efflux MFS transporter permease subunit [candidate division KSB1 bacterium]